MSFGLPLFLSVFSFPFSIFLMFFIFYPFSLCIHHICPYLNLLYCFLSFVIIIFLALFFPSCPHPFSSFSFFPSFFLICYNLCFLKYQILTASPSVNNEGRRKNAPARESNPGSLVYETSALTIEPRELVWLDRNQIL